VVGFTPRPICSWEQSCGICWITGGLGPQNQSQICGKEKLSLAWKPMPLAIQFVAYTLRQACPTSVCCAGIFGKIWCLNGQNEIKHIKCGITKSTCKYSSVDGRGTMLHAGKSRVRFPMKSLYFLIDLQLVPS
jgi:hypothetical protein